MLVEVIAIGIVVMLVATGIYFLIRSRTPIDRYLEITEKCPRCNGRGRVPKK
jgi:hypothetical protein